MCVLVNYSLRSYMLETDSLGSNSASYCFCEFRNLLHLSMPQFPLQKTTNNDTYFIMPFAGLKEIIHVN